MKRIGTGALLLVLAGVIESQWTTVEAGFVTP